jgi:DNA-binding LacI/PurR family transcriptional regulator
MAMVGPFTDADYASRPDRWITHILHGCERELAQAGYHVALFSYDTNDAAAFEKVMSHIERSEGNIAGVMCFLRPALVGLLDQLDKRDIPWVMVNRPRENAGQNFVAYDAFEGGRLVGTCFAKMNLKRIAVLSVPMEAGRASRDQFFGCIQGYIDSGGRFEDIDLIQCDNGTEPMGYERFARYLATSGSPPSAVLAAGDMLAIGAIRACREKGLRIPEDVAIVGSTGLQLSAYSQPPLTVLEVPMERMGQEAGRMLMEMAKEGVRRMMGRFVAGSLVIRDSFKVPEPILVESKQIVAGTP